MESPAGRTGPVLQFYEIALKRPVTPPTEPLGENEHQILVTIRVVPINDYRDEKTMQAIALHAVSFSVRNAERAGFDHVASDDYNVRVAGVVDVTAR